MLFNFHPLDSDSLVLEKGPEICIFNKLPSNSDECDLLNIIQKGIRTSGIWQDQCYDNTQSYMLGKRQEKLLI